MNDWNCSITELMCRTLTLFLACWVILKLVQCAGGLDDAEARDLPDNTVLPSERVRDIDYGTVNTK